MAAAMSAQSGSGDGQADPESATSNGRLRGGRGAEAPARERSHGAQQVVIRLDLDRPVELEPGLPRVGAEPARPARGRDTE